MLAVVLGTECFTSSWYVGMTRWPLKSSRKSRHSWPVRIEAMGAKGEGKGVEDTLLHGGNIPGWVTYSTSLSGWGLTTEIK